MQAEPRDYPVTIDGVTVTLRGVPMVDRENGPSFRQGDGHKVSHMVALGLIRAGATSPGAFFRTRYALGMMKPGDAAELLGVDTATVETWESGQTPVDRNAFAVLAATLRERVGDPMTVGEHLAAMRNPVMAIDVVWGAEAGEKRAA